VAVTLAACRSSGPAAPPPVAPPAEKVAAPIRYLPLAEVLRDGVWTEIGPHAVIGQLGVSPTLLAVVGERDDEVQVVYEDWEARVVGWVPVERLHATVLRPVALAGSAESRPRESHAAVLLLPGVPVAELDRADGRVEISASDGEIGARGWVDDDVLGRVWVAEPFPDDPEATHDLQPGTPIYRSPSTDAVVVATAGSVAKAVELGTRGGWSEIRVVGSWMNVHGFVEESALELTGGAMYGFGKMGGQPPASWPDVPAGTCLVAAAGGEPVGVTLVAMNDREPVPGGAKVELSPPWGDVVLLAEKLTGGGWRTCPIRSDSR